MRLSRPRLRVLAVLILVIAAVVGYEAGTRSISSGSSGAFGSSTRVLSAGSLVLEYPVAWKRIAGEPPIPGLAIVNPLLLAPGGRSDQAALLSGRLPGGQSSPLPAAFLALLREPPHAEVDDFLGGQAYRYSGLSVAGYARTLVLYVIPDPGSGPTVLACSAAVAGSPYLRECARIVSRLTLVGQAQYDLTPNAGYARRLGPLVEALARERVLLRREIHLDATYAAVRTPAGTLAAHFAGFAASLQALEPPLAVSAAQTALAAAALQARDGYRALAAAAAGESPTSYEAAHKQVEGAERAFDSALESFALIGYGG